MLPKIQYPISDLTLPTNGKVVKVRPFLVREEKLLLMAKEAASAEGANYQKEVLRAVQQIVQNCVQEKGFDAEKLAMVDLEWLFLKLRAISVENTVKVSYRDPEDDKVYDFSINLDEIQVDLSKVTDSLIDCGTLKLGMRYPRAALFLGDLPQNGTEELERLLKHTISHIEEAGGKRHDLSEVKPEELQEFIESIPGKALEDIKKFWQGAPNLKHVIKYTNEKGTEREIALTSLFDFFSF
jgi:hypothetical protein